MSSYVPAALTYILRKAILQFFKIRFLLLAHVGKKVKNFTGAHMCTQTQLIMNNLSPTNLPIIKNQVQLGALKV